jgi:hypothetical protein
MGPGLRRDDENGRSRDPLRRKQPLGNGVDDKIRYADTCRSF